MDIVSQIPEYLKVVGAVAVGLPALLAALIAFFMLIPGEQPEKALKGALGIVQKIVAVIEKFSR